MHAQSTFFHQGFDLFDDLDTYMKKVASQVEVSFCHAVYKTGKTFRKTTSCIAFVLPSYHKFGCPKNSPLNLMDHMHCRCLALIKH